MNKLKKCVGSGVAFFCTACIVDITGVVLLFVGIFGDPRFNGQWYGDFLIYTGSVLIFFSLGTWLIWYTWNIRDPLSDGAGGKRHSLVLLARKLTERLSHRMKGEEGVKCVGNEESAPPESPAPPPHKASRVTWGKSTAYNNEGYDDSMETDEETEEANADM